MALNKFQVSLPVQRPGVRATRLLPTLLLPLFALHALGQTFSASITGLATDPSGAVIAGADVILTNVETKDVRESHTGSNGSYNFQNLLPGTYSLATKAPGFKDFTQTGLILRANTAAHLDSAMVLGSASDQVVVNTDTVLVDSETPNNSITMDQVLIANLPNSTRNPLNFVFNLAGTTEAQGGLTSRSQTFDQTASAFGINGGRTAESEILIDGAPSTAMDWGGLIVSPIQDSVQEQQVVSNEYDAEYHGGGEGVVTLVTKNGSDRLHFEVYDYFRNDALDANYWSNKNVDPAIGTITPRQKFHRNQFGGNVSGPIWHSRHLFFFGAYEGLRQPGTEGRQLYTVPTALERKGDFSQTYNHNGTLSTIYDPYSTTTFIDASGNTQRTRTPYFNNIIPGGLDPVGQKLVNLYPLPNLPGDGPDRINNYAATPSSNTSNDKFDARIDWAQNEKHRLFGRVSDRVRQNNAPGCVFCNGADNYGNNQDHAFQIALNDTITPSAKWVIDTYAAYSRWWEGQTLVGYGVADLTTIGLPESYSQIGGLLPSVSAGQYTNFGNPYSSFQRYIRYSNTNMINITHELHSQTLKFGFNYDISMINIRQDTPPSFNFGNSQTSCDVNPDNPTGPCEVQLSTNLTGNPIASMLIGVGSGGTSNINMDPAMSAHSFGLYVQDNWRATRNFTVYAGLRYENQRPATERHNRLAYFDPNLTNSLSSAAGFPIKGGFEYAGVDGRGRGAWEADNLNFSPRLGLAYRATDRLTLRAGSGIFYAPASAMLGYDGGGQFPGYTSQTPWVATQDQQGYVPANLVSNPFPGGIQQPTGNTQGDQTYIGFGTGQAWLKGPHPTGVLYQWSADVQYQVSNHSVFEVGYTGVRGRRLLYGNPNLDFDQLPTADLALGKALDNPVPNPYASVITNPYSFLSSSTVSQNSLLRPFPAIGYLQLTRSTPGARSQFDALNIKYNHSFSAGLSSITTYRWSKNLDDGSEARIGWTGVDFWRDSTNTKLDYSYSTHDVPQSFAEALVYQLPYGPGRRFGGGAPQLMRQSLGGWNVSTAVRLSSGLPLPQPVQFSYNNLNNYGFPGGGLPDLVGNPKPQHRNKYQWINPAAFAGASLDGSASANCGTDRQNLNCVPFSYRYGNEPNHLNSLREAANNNADLGIAKQFGTERFITEFRADILNLFNHPIYGGSGNISTTMDYGDLGKVYGTRNDPRNIQLSLKVSY